MQQPPQLMNITTEHIQKRESMYEPNTIDLSDHKELEYWFTVLSEHLPDLVDKGYC
ncbi:hypothetical protein PVK06_040908 [Gossypium arboreum]|uniref:Uncharacterized protein n=1 Tax=Gossypium arboreum TaxID=29729 RepID=A0ABR0N6R5_GOSAR|nr:hypothetical protein PVK06_040908 [Gossypium arboreum]